ncbi:ABC transporter substrate-binding protein [Roseomonas sp. NAR14]|uniref:ABC transporter substrate-binding protein n=1 Tax=Roseomonas acroporae TaxID=2937791 RepID=A0A9X1YA44_9PROT|nr:ABC transporter substrate-binding protein [Roseomonas acroporae]MCK8785890.1 ABC transporter substrate-binding protein [Roseomonas acroporae]
MKLAIPDLISPSYFPAIAAVELGCLAREGLDVSLEMVAPVERSYAMLRGGELDIVGGSAHSALAAFPDWRGVRLLCAQSRGMYWFLVMRAALGIARGDLAALRGRRIGAAPFVGLALRHLLRGLGLDPEANDIGIVPIPGTERTNFGVAAARALEAGTIDGFWANGMGTEIALRRGIGTLVLDARRDAVAAPWFLSTMPVMAVTDEFARARPEAAAAIVRATTAAQALLREDPARATAIGRKLFPAEEAEMIAELVRRDAPFYTPGLPEGLAAGLDGLGFDLGLQTPGSTAAVALGG